MTLGQVGQFGGAAQLLSLMPLAPLPIAGPVAGRNASAFVAAPADMSSQFRSLVAGAGAAIHLANRQQVLQMGGYPGPKRSHRDENFVAMRQAWEAAEAANPPSVKVEHVEGDIHHVIDEDGHVWLVRSDRAYQFHGARDGGEVRFRRPTEFTCAGEWMVPNEVAMDIESAFKFWHATGNPSDLARAVREGAEALNGWRIQSALDKVEGGVISDLPHEIFEGSRIGGRTYRSRESYDGILLEFEAMTDRRFGDSLSWKERTRAMDVMMALDVLLNDDADGLFDPDLDAVLVHPDAYEWADRNVAGTLRIALIATHEFDHLIDWNWDRGILSRLLRKFPLTGLISMLINPFQVPWVFRRKYLSEMSARGAEWEFLFRIPPMARRALLSELAQGTGLRIVELLSMTRAEAAAAIRERFGDDGFEDRRVAAKIFYRLYDAAHMSRKQFVALAMREEKIDWKLPYREYRRRWKQLKKKKGKARKIAFVLGMAWAAAKLAGAAYLLKKLKEYLRDNRRKGHPARGNLHVLRNNRKIRLFWRPRVSM